MAFAQGARSELSYIVETTFGTTPGSPQMIKIPFNTHSLNLNKSRVQGSQIQGDRMLRVDRHGNQHAIGDIVADLRAGDFDDFLESAFFNAFGSSGASTIKIGTTPQFMTIQDAALDITQFRKFTGMAVSQMNVSVAPDQMVQATFSMVGKNMTLDQTNLDATPTEPQSNEPFDSFSGSISEGGSPIALITAMNFSINNGFAPAHVIGANTPPQLEFGMAVVEGQVSAYFEDETLLDKFLDETDTSLQLVLDETVSGETYTFDFPRVKYNGGDVPVSNPQSRIITLPFVALYDSSESTNLKLTRSA